MNIEILIEQILRKMSRIGKIQAKFFINLAMQWLRQRGRYCFDNLVRQGFMNAMSYRLNFDKGFNFKEFNRILIELHASSERIICFDPSFISKSGKHTYGMGYFWSGCAQSVKKGLEIGALSIGDAVNNTAFHYYAAQTVLQEGQSLMEHYTTLIVSQAAELLLLSRYVVVDAYFAKHNFINDLNNSKLSVITRLRDDAALWYLYQGPKTTKRGRPTKYDGKVNLKHLDMKHFSCFDISATYKAFEAVVFSKSLKRPLKVVVVHNLKDENTIKSIKIFACTDTSLEGFKVWKYYRLRFQQEFLFRDAKQFFGLNHCQSRQKDRLSFQFNFSLTMISIAKIVHWLTIPKHQRPAFSIQDIKTQYVNEHLLDKFIFGLGICPETTKKSANYQNLINYTKIAA